MCGTCCAQHACRSCFPARNTPSGSCCASRNRRRSPDYSYVLPWYVPGIIYYEYLVDLFDAADMFFQPFFLTKFNESKPKYRAVEGKYSVYYVYSGSTRKGAELPGMGYDLNVFCSRYYTTPGIVLFAFIQCNLYTCT